MRESDTPITAKLLSVIYRIDAKNLNAISAETFDEICDKMKKKVTAEQASWRRRIRAQERLGYSAQEAERSRHHYKRAKQKWMRRKLSDADRAILAQAWQ